MRIPQVPTTAIPIFGGICLVLLLVFLKDPFLAFLSGITSLAIAGLLEAVKSCIPRKKRAYRNAFLVCVAMALLSAVLFVFPIESIAEGDDISGIFLLIFVGPPLVASIIAVPILGCYWLTQRDNAANSKLQERSLRILLSIMFLLVAVYFIKDRAI